MSIFREQISRKPDNYPWTREFMESMWHGHWTAAEFSFASDIQDFKVNLTDQEREIIKRNLSAIGQIEVAVKTFWAKVGENLPHPSISDLGYVMANVEVIHNIAYEKLLKVLDLEHVFEENLKLDIIDGRVKYLRKYLHKHYKDKQKQYVYSLVLFTLFVENVSLFSQFYTVNYFNRFKNVLKDTAQQVKYTASEETIHALVGIKLINTIKEEHPELFDAELIDRIKSEAICAFEAESKIIDWASNGYEAKELNESVLKNFIKHRINTSLNQIGIENIFEIDQDLLKLTVWFDEDTLGNNMSDFFHSRPTEYAKKNQSFESSSLFD